jgi:phosphotransferase family enzyme
MNQNLLEIIPADRREIAASAISAAFGSRLTALQPVYGGASGALLYRIEAAGQSYLLRMETRRSPLRNPHQYACMQIAADAGIAPPLHYVDDATGISIMDFISPRPLREYPGGPVQLTQDLGGLVRKLQATSPFPELHNYLAILSRLLGYVRNSGLFAAGLLDPHAAGFERIREVYRWDPSALVSSHNDPNPRNIIFDGERLWLVDWETAYRNDPLTDVAIVAENFAATPELENALLEAWMGHAPDRALRARFTLMRVLTRLYYAGLMLSISAAAPRSDPDTDLSAPTPEEFHAEVADGRVKAGAPETMYTLGKMLLAGFLTGLSAPSFEEAVAIVRQG